MTEQTEIMLIDNGRVVPPTDQVSKDSDKETRLPPIENGNRNVASRNSDEGKRSKGSDCNSIRLSRADSYNSARSDVISLCSSKYGDGISQRSTSEARLRKLRSLKYHRSLESMLKQEVPLNGSLKKQHNDLVRQKREKDSGFFNLMDSLAREEEREKDFIENLRRQVERIKEFRAKSTSLLHKAQSVEMLNNEKAKLQRFNNLVNETSKNKRKPEKSYPSHPNFVDTSAITCPSEKRDSDIDIL